MMLTQETSRNETERHPSETVAISIITINLNNAAGLRKTVDSVLPQLTNACEYLLIDGGSTDGSLGTIRSIDDERAHWVSEPDGGIYAAMNKGIARATGDYCLFLNSGDWLVPDVLAEALNATQTGESVIYFNTYRHYGPRRVEEEVYPDTLTMRSFYRATIGHQSTLVRRELFEKFGAYDTALRLHADYAFWLQTIIANNVSCKHVDRFLTYYDMNGQSARPNPHTRQEVDAALYQTLPPRVLDDYAYWHAREQDMAVLTWYRRQKMLYGLLVVAYKVQKNLRRLFRKRSNA